MNVVLAGVIMRSRKLPGQSGAFVEGIMTYFPGFKLNRIVTSRGPPGGLNFGIGSLASKNFKFNGVGRVFAS